MSRGYIAITTSIILSLIMLAVAVALGSSSFFSRNNSLNFSFKKTSYFAARSCLDYALLQLSLNSGYSGNETKQVGEEQCSLRVIETSGSNKIIKARSQARGAVTNLKLTVQSSDLSTVYLEEVQQF